MTGVIGIRFVPNDLTNVSSTSTNMTSFRRSLDMSSVTGLFGSSEPADSVPNIGHSGISAAGVLPDDYPAAVSVKTVGLVAVPPGVATVILPVDAPVGTVAVTEVADTAANVTAALPLNLTPVAPVRFVPTIVTFVPTGPEAGVKDVIVGAGIGTVKAVALVAVPPGVVTVILPVDAFAGTVVVIDFADTTVNAADVVPNFMLVAPVKFVPPIVTVVPTGPAVGVNDVMVGTGMVTV